MTKEPSPPTRRDFLASSAAAVVAVSVAAGAASIIPTDAALAGEAIRPFRVHTPQAEIVELRHRIAATRWPERELVANASQGVQLATMRELARHWATIGANARRA
jgi:hypothetical protein